MPEVNVLPQVTGCTFLAVSFPMPLEFSVVKSKHFAGLFCCFVFVWFFFPRKQAGSGSALSHHSKILIFHFDFVLGLISSTRKKGSKLDAPSSFPTSTTVLLLQPGQQEQIRVQIWQKLVHRFPRLEMQGCTSSLNSSPFPQLMWHARKHCSFLFVC